MAIACLALAPPSGEAREPAVFVTDIASGCFHHVDASRKLRLGTARRRLGVASPPTLEALRRLVLDAGDERDVLLERLGITPDAVRAHRKDVLAAAAGGDGDVAVPTDIEPMLGFEGMTSVVLQRLGARPADLLCISTSKCRFMIEVPGDPPMSVESRSCEPLMLPWTIRVGEREWQSWSLELSRALASLTARRSPNRSLLAGENYWREEFWSDPGTWTWRCSTRGSLGERLAEARATEKAMAVEGFASVASEFEVEGAYEGWVNSVPLALRVTLRPCSPGPIDLVTWSNPLGDDGAPTRSWFDFLQVSAAAEAAVTRRAWLAAWRAERPDRNVYWSGVGPTGYEESDMDLVVAAWRDAGLAGEPEYGLRLANNDDGYAKVYLATGVDEGLVTSSSAGKGERLLDGPDVLLHRMTPDYLLIRPDGRIEARRLPNEDVPWILPSAD